jgi:hypothetical protein
MNRSPEWNRVSERDGAVLFKDGASFNDIIQGALGDCYLLSSLGVLGNDYARGMYILEETDDEWMECGALCIRFWENGQPDYVIIDDFMPMRNGSFVFA